MRRPTAIAVTAIAAVVFTAPLMLFLLGVRSAKGFENRALAGRPAVSLGSLVDTEWYQDVTAYYTDHVPLRREAVAIDAWIDYRILDDSPNPDGVVIGAGHWLFNPESFVCPDDRPETAAVVANANLLMDVLDASGRRVAFVLVPGKQMVVTDLLGPLAERAACSIEANVQLREAMAADPPKGSVDAWGSLSAAYAGGEQVYFRDDSHWNPAGAAIVGEQIVKRLWPGMWSDADLVAVPDQERVGDLVAQMGLDFTETYSLVLAERPGVTVTSRSRWLDKGPQVHLHHTTAEAGTLIDRAQVLLLGDSFSVYLDGEYLAPFAQDVVLFRWRALQKEDTVDTFDAHVYPDNQEWLLERIRGSDAVVVESVDIRSWQRFDTPDFAYMVMDTLSDQLPHVDVDPRGRRFVGFTVDPPPDPDLHPYLLIRADVDVRFNSWVMHRSGNDDDWVLAAEAESPIQGLAVIDLGDLPEGGDLSLRIRSIDIGTISYVRIVWV